MHFIMNFYIKSIKQEKRERRLTQIDGKNTAVLSECKLLLKSNVLFCWT